MSDFDFDSTGFFDVNGFVEHLERYGAEEPTVGLSSADIKAVKASKRTWADVYADDDTE